MLKRPVPYFLVCWLTALLTHASGLYAPMHSDYSIFLRIGRDWAAGGQPLYQSIYDNKSPLVYLWARLLDSPWPAGSLYLAETLLAAVAALALSRALARFHGAIAFAAPVLLIAWSGNGYTFCNGQSTEAPALWFAVLAVSAWMAALPRGSLVFGVLTGLALFLTSAFYPPYLALLLVLAVLTPFLVDRHRLRTVVYPVLGLAGGWLLGLGALLAHARWAGYLNDCVDVLRYNVRYASLGNVPLSASIAAFAKTLRTIVDLNPLPLLGICTTVCLAVRRLAASKQTRLVLALGISWLVAATVAVFPGGRHFPHYYQMLWAPLAVLACAGLLWSTRDDDLAWWLPRLVAATVFCGIVMLLAHDGGRIVAKVRKSPDSRPAAIQEAAQYLDSHTRPDEPVVLFVWDDWAELYWRVPRPSVDRHVIPTMLAFIRPAFFREWHRDLVEHPPAWLVIDRTFADWARDVPALGDEFQEVGKFVAATYTEVYRKNELRVLARHPSGTR